jgi:hypothetical protein
LPGGKRELWLPLINPTTMIGYFNDKAEYELTVVVAADNAAPNKVKVKFEYDPNEGGLKIASANATRFPWWRDVWDAILALRAKMATRRN